MSFLPIRHRPARAAGLLALGLILAAGAGSPVRAEGPAKKDPKGKPAPATKPEKPTTNPLQALMEYIQQQRESAARRQAMNNLKQLGIAVHKYEAAAGKFPPAGKSPNNFEWLLPYLESGQVYGPYGVAPARLTAVLELEARLGATTEPANEVLATHLALPKGQGQVVGRVTAGGPAAKVGLKPHDILLQIAGKPVSSDPVAFNKALAALAPNTPVTAALVRGGKRLEVKGLRLAKAPDKPLPIKSYVVPSTPWTGIPMDPASITDGTSNTIFFGEKWAAGGGKEWTVWAAAKPILATTFRREDRFTTRQEEGSLVLTVTGTVKGGKAQVSGIKVQDGTAVHQYPSLAKVPAEYRDKVARLVEKSAGEAKTGK